MSATPEADIAALRAEIDALDAQLLNLLNGRAERVRALGQIKQEQGLPIYAPGREQRLLQVLCARNPGPLRDVDIVALWRELFMICRELQHAEYEKSARC